MAKEEEKNKGTKTSQKTINKIALVRPYLSIIALNEMCEILQLKGIEWLNG